MAEAAGDWFRDIVRALFGSWDAGAQERYIREVFALVPKKNSKTSYGALIMLVAIIMNERPNAAFHLVAPAQDVADLAFEQAAGAIRLDKALETRFKVQSHIKTITSYSTGCTLEVMSFDPSVLTGTKSAGWLLDELHVVAKNAKALSAVGQLRGGMIAQPEAFGIFITTQSEQPPVGVFRAELARARAIRDGRASGRMLPVLYEFPDSIAKRGERGAEAWRDPALWPMVIPNAGRSITIERLEEEFSTARDLGEDEVRRWASQHLNIEVGLALRSDRWAGADLWEDAKEEGITLEHILAVCEVAAVGIDGGGADDLFALVVVGRERETMRWLLWGRCWAQRIVLERRKQIASQLLDLEAHGQLIFVDEPGPEVEQAADIVRQLDNAGILAAVGLDPMGIGEVIDALAERGITGTDRVLGIPQGWKVSASIKTVERKLANGTLVHGGQEIMSWAVSNAKAEPRGNAVAIDKAAAGSAKIDPVVATFNAVAIMSRNPEPTGGGYAYTGI